MCGLLLGVDCARTVTENLNWTIPIPAKHQGQLNSIRRSLHSSELQQQQQQQSIPKRKRTSYKKYSSSLASSSPNPGPSQGSLEYRVREVPDESSSKKLIGVVHLTDIHVDPYYTEGSEAACGEPLCCRPSEGKVDPKKAAGKWGDYRSCDTPIRTVRNALKHISENHPDVSPEVLL